MNPLLDFWRRMAQKYNGEEWRMVLCGMKKEADEARNKRLVEMGLEPIRHDLKGGES